MPAGKFANSKAKPRPKRGGRYCMMLELHEHDRDLLEKLLKRYEKVVASPNRAWVIRQLIRNMSKLEKLPPVVSVE